MSATAYIQLTPPAQALLKRIQDAPATCLNAMKKSMDKENALTVSHIQRAYLSFGKGGPSNLLGLRAQSGSLRRSLRANAATATGNVITSSIGGNVTNKGVNYLAVHEFGATIPPHTITARGKCLAFMIGGKQVFAKSVKHPGMTLPARGMIQRGIKDRLPDYGAALSAAVVNTLGGTN
jgi:hypothetical protein